MGWDRGLYYTRSRKVNGRVMREYVGGGQLGALAAQLDELERDERKRKADEFRAVRTEWGDLDAPLADLNERCDLLARAALLVAGYRRHKRGEWRKKRVRTEETG